jgi:hypothetical protein
VQAVLAFRDANINKGQGWRNGFGQSQVQHMCKEPRTI